MDGIQVFVCLQPRLLTALENRGCSSSFSCRQPRLIFLMAFSEKISNFGKGFFPLFYLETPFSSSFKDLSEVPNYLQQVSRGMVEVRCFHEFAGKFMLQAGMDERQELE